MITTRTNYNGAVIEVKGTFSDDAKKTLNQCLEEILLRHVDDLISHTDLEGTPSCGRPDCYKNKTKIELDKA